jgi:hypothetical protein
MHIMNISAERLARVRTARNHALKIIRECGGQWEKNTGRGRSKRHLSAKIGDLIFLHTTPFSGSDPTPNAPTYLHALAMQSARPDLPYQIDVWFCGKKVLSLQWDDKDELQVISFRPGEWEIQLASAHSPDHNA